MKIEEFNYPLIIFKDNDKNIYSISNDFGLASKGAYKFYSKLTVVDSIGNVYILKKAKIKHLAPFLKCLKNFQRMWEMDLDFDKGDKMSIGELKKKIVYHVSKNPKHWLCLDTLDGIKELVGKAESFRELAKIFR